MVRCLVAALTLLTALGASAQMPPPPTKLSSVMPPDAPANPPFSFGAIAAFQRKLDIFAWQEFIAMNWPAARPGIPSQKSIGGNVTGDNGLFGLKTVSYCRHNCRVCPAMTVWITSVFSAVTNNNIFPIFTSILTFIVFHFYSI